MELGVWPGQVELPEQSSMEEGSKKSKQQAVVVVDQASGSKPRPHWRRRDPADTAVYVVHPTQFRAVVQQLTGAPSSPPPAAAPQHQEGGYGTMAAPQHQAAAGTTSSANNAPPPQPHGGGDDSSGRTLGQMQQECMAWANSQDDARM